MTLTDTVIGMLNRQSFMPDSGTVCDRRHEIVIGSRFFTFLPSNARNGMITFSKRFWMM
jgi:hypothetical protein